MYPSVLWAPVGCVGRPRTWMMSPPGMTQACCRLSILATRSRCSSRVPSCSVSSRSSPFRAPELPCSAHHVKE